MQYTCAYFHKKDMDLDEAQLAKMELIAKKLDLKPGMKVLDLGCGFGSMAHHLVTKYNVSVTGVTLSKEQKKYADDNYSHPNMDIQLKDYRMVTGKFDRVYSVGIMEHIGRKNYHEYYDKCYELLVDDGIMLIHTIGCSYPEWDTAGGCFLMTYIFPGAEIPHIANLTDKFADKWHLEDFQNFGLSYAKTLRAWRKNINNWENLDTYSDRFRRMWHFYLLESTATFQQRKNSLWQIVYIKRESNRLNDCHHIRD
jgi:cyclopropane-fatty-acyl-phospholipid synthase